MSASIFRYNPKTRKEKLLGSVGDEAAIGKSPGAAVRLDDLRCDGIHALIERDGDAFYLTDLGSHFGTYYKGKRVQMVRLRAGEVFVIGNHHLTLRPGAETDLERATGGVFREEGTHGPFIHTGRTSKQSGAAGPRPSGSRSATRFRSASTGATSSWTRRTS
jgi:hypothetical protein